MYQYCHHTNTEIITQDTNVGLHDCKATQVSLKDGLLSFSFLDGFWVRKKESDKERLFYTDKGQVNFKLLYDANVAVTIYIFTEKNGKVLREEFTIEELMYQINNELYSLEFLYSYIGYQTIKFDCWIWFDKEPYHKESELIISVQEITYQWNNLYKEL